MNRFVVLRRGAPFALAVTLVAVGCSLLGGADPVRVPPVQEIRSIAVWQQGAEPPPPTVIEDPDRIGRFARWIGALDSGWREPWDTFPAGNYTVIVDAGDDRGAVFWPGARHIGGREFDEGGKRKRLRGLSSEEAAELREILDIDEDGAPR